jgi:glutathione S-transferase
LTYDFYWISGSPNSWRVMLTLEHKGIAYHSHRLDPSKREQKHPAFLLLNPFGTVPVLRSEETVVTESIAIMAYLDSACPSQPLFGQTATETGLIWQRVFEFVNGLRGLIDEGVVRPLSHGVNEVNGSVLKDSSLAVHAGIAGLEGVLSASDYLAGSGVSAADFSVLPNLMMLMRLGSRPEAAHLGFDVDKVRSRYPAVAGWLARLEALPAYRASYPPHWRPTAAG